jgi:tetratricopeptide (TPR) repeat protein
MKSVHLCYRLLRQLCWRVYNNDVQANWSFAFVFLTAAVLAQSAPPPCPADRPLDDIIQQSKKEHRNGNPLPQVICTPECINRPITTPETFPDEPQVEVSTRKSTSSTEPESKANPINTCGEAMKMAVRAAHDVEVGDSYFGHRNYSGALLRYNDAVEEKPGDLAIHVRLARTFEKLGQIPHAIQEYKTAQKLAGPQKWSEEAKSSLIRLQHASGS